MHEDGTDRHFAPIPGRLRLFQRDFHVASLSHDGVCFLSPAGS
jgi:hypothetical protein